MLTLVCITMDGDHHGELPRYHLFFGCDVSSHIKSNTLEIQTNYFSCLTLEEKKKLCVPCSPPAAQWRQCTGGLFCPFLVVLMLDYPLSANKQSWPKVHLQFTRNATTIPALHRLTWANSSLKKEHTSPTSVFLLVKYFLYPYFPTTKYICSPSVNSPERRKIHTFIHLLALPLKQVHAKKEKKHAAPANDPNRNVKRHSCASIKPFNMH